MKKLSVIICTVILLSAVCMQSAEPGKQQIKIEDVDENFVPLTVGNVKLNFRNVKNPPFSLEGMPFRHQTVYKGTRRLPDSIGGKVNGAVFWLAHLSAGVTVRFRTDSRIIAIHGREGNRGANCHTGQVAFDMYRGTAAAARHFGTYVPPDDKDFSAILTRSHDGTMAEFSINYPIGCSVEFLEVGILPGAKLEAPSVHKNKPVLFYGSSITQGNLVSRPGNHYTTRLCRAVDAEQINFGFSGQAKGDLALAELIAEQDIACFVYDYDYNAPNPDFLKKTHEPFFLKIREKKPQLPIIIISKCSIFSDMPDYKVNQERRAVIKATYDHAVANGDKHVWFIDGETLFGTAERDACTMDGCHPNDLGFFRMYENILPVLQTILQNTQNK